MSGNGNKTPAGGGSGRGGFWVPKPIDPPAFTPAPPVERQIIDRIADLLRRVTGRKTPNINPLWSATKDIDIIRLNIKNLGYEIARRLQQDLLDKPAADQPGSLGLSSRAAKQREVESEWFRYWCGALKIAPIYHRKIWEFCFVLQSLHDADLLKPGVRALGFGCGEEPLPSYFASRGIRVTVTDLDEETVRGMGWAETGQHTSTLDKAWHGHLVDRSIFDELVRLRHVDMNRIPDDLRDYDFCWSVCSLEHLGSIANGLAFIENSLKTVRIGGLAVHTTEYNYLSNDETIDNWQTVLFLRKHFETVAQVLSSRGHTVYPLDFDVGDGVLDRFVDLPPYEFGNGWLSREQWSKTNQAAHLKLAIDGFACTCFGIVVRRGA